MDVRLRSELAVRGVRVDAPVRRRGGAGPSDDGHVVLDGAAATLPLVADSPWAIGADGGLQHDDRPDHAGSARPIGRPAFYDLTTADGTPYHQIARLHGSDVLASTVVQTCSRYAEQTRCRFCAIEESLAAGTTPRVKSPADLAEVARAAAGLDGVRQVVLTTGTSVTADRGARYLVRCVRAIVEAEPQLAVQVQCEPPADLRWISRLRSAGATAIGIHIEALDQEVRRRWTPGKASVPVSQYRRAWAEAVEVFGWNRVSTYLLVGLGEDPNELVTGALELAAVGVYPFVVPFRPLAGTLAATVPPPDPGLVADVTERVAAGLRDLGMRGADQGAGCAACGACSALGTAGA